MSIPLPWWLIIWVLIPYLLYKTVRVLLVRVLPFTWRNWCSLLIVAGALYLRHRSGWLGLVLVLLVTAGLLTVWWWRRPASFARWVRLPVRAWRLRVFFYRRHWREAMTTCRLAQRFDATLTVPKLLRVRCTHATDELTVRMPRGQNPDDWHRAATDLAYSFNARVCRVYSGTAGTPPLRTGRLAPIWRAVDRVRYRDRPRLVRLVVVRRDPLSAIVPALPVPAMPDFAALPLGLREDLHPFLLRLLATHVLIVGATRSGKGSVQWSLVRAMAPAIRSGLVRLWGIDPKGGVELSIGAALFTRLEYTDPGPMVAMLEDLVSIMRDRQARMQGHIRAHTPTLDEPLYVLMVDEMIALVALLLDVELRNRARSALALLLTQGAGLGVLVVGATQDPRKEIIELRDFFPTRIGLRLTERNHVDMVLGDGARTRGALCDLLSPDPGLRGIGYVVLDGQPEPMRVRFGYCTDTDVRAMATRYAAPATTAPGPQPSEPQPASRTEPPATPPRRVPRPRTAGPLLPDSLAEFLGRDSHQERDGDGRDAA
ncbi:FtsK/SpoIIIE domain-containing protein [Dactylosporangium sp. CA-092794]|uniref:FtsK/SpoIIIE domain-containing protein n=1 Tax=Dactylosporangium sp. CA-092794 TaxID=3239929 RepID=UPI003D92320C